MACETPHDLDLYPIVGKKEMKFIDVEYQIQVGYWVVRNHLRDYKIYVMVICMFDEDFSNSLLHPLGDNPWLSHLTNQNYKTQFLKQSDYVLGFVSSNKYSLDIAINKKWQENQIGSKEDE
jgi:hypothetical protein